nr:hypothetical protein [Amycolatopsis sp. ATCC 39116]
MAGRTSNGGSPRAAADGARHRFLVLEPRELSVVRLDIYPDGGMARLRLWGALTERGRADFERRFTESSG